MVVSAEVLARERVLPVVEPLRPLVGDGGLVRGHHVACRGDAAMSLALAVAVGPVASGSWLAVVDVPWLGLEAAAGMGIPLERLVRVDSPTVSPATWAELMAAVLDGFDLVVTRVPARLDAGLARRVRARVQARGAVVVDVGAGDRWARDLTLRSVSSRWEGLAAGHGYLRARRVTVEAQARRSPWPRRGDLWLPGPDGHLAAAPAATDQGRLPESGGGIAAVS